MSKEIDLTINPHIGLLVNGGIVALLKEEHASDVHVYELIIEFTVRMAKHATEIGLMPNRVVYHTRGEAAKEIYAPPVPAITLHGHVKNGGQAFVYEPCPIWLSAMIE